MFLQQLLVVSWGKTEFLPAMRGADMKNPLKQGTYFPYIKANNNWNYLKRKKSG
jgi:hypothetical protein